jgi:hypothetical protein
MIASTLSFSTSRRAALSASAGSPRLSSITIFRGRPLIPPAALICFSSITAVFFSGIPSDDASPVIAKIAPIT